MSDTARTKDDFLNAVSGLFKDNAAGDISPQDLRDFVESLHPSFGSFYVTVPLDTVCTVQSTWYKAGADGGATTQVAAHRFTPMSPNRLTYNALPNVHLHIACSFSMMNSGNNRVIGVSIAKNGAVEAGSELQVKHGTGSDVNAAALHWDLAASTGDYIEVFVRNVDAAGETLTLPLMYLFTLGMFR